MRRQWTGRLHEVAIAIGPNGRTLRYCKNCGASWELLNEITHFSWRPIQELDPHNERLEADIDIRECSGGSAPVGAATQPQAVETVPTVAPAPDKPKDLCWCPTCKVKKQHYEGNPNCFCVKCQGQKTHRG